MELTEAIKNVENTDLFKKWKEKHEKWFLAHGFLMDSEEWQIGYSDSEKITTFLMNEVIESQEVVKAGKVKPLNPEELLPLEEAMIIFEEIKKKEYSSEQIFKKVILIQNIEEPVYNITGLTQSLKTLNVKILMDGTIKEHSLKSLVGEV